MEHESESNSLHHVFAASEHTDDEILPLQPHSIHDELVKLKFSADVTISLSVDAAPGCGGITWPAGEVLANYLVYRGPMRNKVVLELGSGTGLVGLVAAMLGASAFITDQLALMKIMEKNIALNDLSASSTALELNWGDPLPVTIPRPSDISMILAADCVYFEPAFPLLVQTLDDLCLPKTEVLFCYKKRRKADKRFFALLKKRFVWEEVMDDPNRGRYHQEGITLLRLHTRRYI